jgi:hypothetical protein
VGDEKIIASFVFIIDLKKSKKVFYWSRDPRRLKRGEGGICLRGFEWTHRGERVIPFAFCTQCCGLSFSG